MKNQAKQTLRTFIHSLLAGLAVALALELAGRGSWSAGFLIGAGLSLFSLYSLKVCVPALFRKGAPRYATAVMQALLLFKVPLYGVGLYFATRFGTEGSFAAFAGCALVPCVITLETLGKVAMESSPYLRRISAMRAEVTALPIAERHARLTADRQAPSGCEAAEPLILSPKSRTVREGAA